MKRRDSIKLFSSLGLSIAGLNSLAGPINLFWQEAYTTERIRGNAGIFKARGGTIAWLINEDGIAVVDSQFPEQSELLLKFLGEQSERPVRLLFNTHHHGDHSSGNISFKGVAEKVVAHENSKANQERVASSRENSPEQLLPDTTFSGEWSGVVGNEKITSTWFGAAHTNGDAVIHFENANMAHVGDLVFNRRHPYIDQNSGANIENWISVLQSIRKKYDRETIFICGHSGSDFDIKLNRDDLIAKEHYFEVLLETVGKMIKDGRSKEEILATSKLEGLDWPAENPQRSVTAAYNELTSE